MTDNVTVTDETTASAPATEGKKKPGGPATYDAEVFCATLREVHAAGGSVQDVADRLGMSKLKVGQISAHLRNIGTDLPLFKRGRRPGQKNAPASETTPEASTPVAE